MKNGLIYISQGNPDRDNSLVYIWDGLKRVVVRDSKVEKFIPGRLPDLRPLTGAELASVLLVSIPLDECSVKVRTGDGDDAVADRALPVWAGELPLRVVPGQAVPDEHVPAGTAVPEYLRSWGLGRTGV